MVRNIFKISQEPEDFQFRRPTNNWLKRPVYYLFLILIVVFGFGGYLYYYNLSYGQNSIITKNTSPGVEQVSGISTMKEVDQYQNYLNILLLGTGGPNHPGGGLTDVIQLLSINTKTNRALIFSIPRDLYVDVDGYGYHKINTAYNLGQQSGHGGGGILAKKEASQVLGVPINYYLKVDFDGFEKIVDIVGGVDICVDQAINDSQNKIYISSGCQHMTGASALAYARSRYSTSDFDRSQRQQKLIFAIKEKILGLNFLLNPIKINQAFSALTGNLNTDIKISELRAIGDIFANIDRDRIDSYVLDNRKDNLLYSTMKDGAYVLLPTGEGFKKIQKFVDQKLPGKNNKKNNSVKDNQKQ